MSLAFTVLAGSNGSEGAGTNSTNLSLGTVSAGDGVLMCVTGYDNAGNLDFTSVDISGETVVALGSTVTDGAGGVAGRWFKINSVQSGGAKTATINYNNGMNAASLAICGMRVTGHDTSNFVPTVAALDLTNPAHIAITTANANSGVVSLVKGGFADGGSSSSPINYSMDQTVYGAQNRTRMFYATDVGAAGSKDQAVTQGWWALTIEVKAGATGITGTSTSTLGGTTGSSDAYIAQVAAPASDGTLGSWQSTGANLFSSIDEYPANDSDYISTFTKNSRCRIKLASMSDPNSSTGHKMYYRIKGDGSANIVVRLYSGGTSSVGTGTLIKTWTHSPAPASFTDYDQTLSGGEADAITDYANLYLEFEAT